MHILPYLQTGKYPVTHENCSHFMYLTCYAFMACRQTYCVRGGHEASGEDLTPGYLACVMYGPSYFHPPDMGGMNGVLWLVCASP